jgi:hypothetical protein
MEAMMKGAVAVLLATGLSGIAFAPPAWAESISLSCANDIETLVVNVDLATSAVTEGHVADQGTRWGPYTAQITSQVIAWDTGPIWRITLSRVTGVMHRLGRAGSDIHYNCSQRSSPKKIF